MGEQDAPAPREKSAAPLKNIGAEIGKSSPKSFSDTRGRRVSATRHFIRLPRGLVLKPSFTRRACARVRA